MSGPEEQPAGSYDYGGLYSQPSPWDVRQVNEMTPVQAFRWYNQHGYIALPVRESEKRLILAPGYRFDALPRPTEQDIAAWERAWRPEWRVGLIMSTTSRQLAIDVDDIEAFARLSETVEITPTISQTTRDGTRLHLVYEYPDGVDNPEIFRDMVLAQGSWSRESGGIEIKSKGLIVAAPSVHTGTGQPYRWREDGPVAGTPAEIGPALLNLRRQEVRESAADAEAMRELARRAGIRRADEIERAEVAEPVPERPGLPLGEFLATAPEVPDFEIPGLVPAATRVITTGEEGSGKSTLARFVAGHHAAGIQPFTGERYDGGTTLLLDCENPPVLLQMRLVELRNALGADAAGAMDERLVIESQIGGIDLAATYWQEYLLRLADVWKPGLLVVGPLYKMCASYGPMSEEFFEAVAQFLDRLRDEHGCALWVEAHVRQPAPGQAGRDKFPYGNTGWRRWPEAGVHLGRVGELTEWRPNRWGANVSWPSQLLRMPGWQVLWQAAGGPARMLPGPALPAAGPSAEEKLMRSGTRSAPGMAAACANCGMRSTTTAPGLRERPRRGPSSSTRARGEGQGGQVRDQPALDSRNQI